MNNTKKTGLIKIRVSKKQHEIIKNKAEAKGFESIAQYIRSIALEKDLVIERKIDDIHKIVTNWKTTPRKRHKKEDLLI